MQGAAPVNERLRFQWIPVLVWEVDQEEILAYCYGWYRTVQLSTQIGVVTEEWVYDFYYERPVKQAKEESFDKWIGEIYQADLSYLNNSLWVWIQENFGAIALCN